MEKASKDELVSKVKFLEGKLRDVVTAYKSLQNEKKALENGLKAIKNASNDISSSDTGKNEKEKENLSSSEDEKLSSEVATLMNSLTSLSAEKSRMEANFQADKKKLRQENERLETTIRELQDKMKSINLEHNKEIEQLKTKLIVERHEREKEQNEYQTRLRDLQNYLKQEQESKMFLEQAFSEITLREESQRNKQVEQSEKILNIQQAHLSALEKEKQKFQQEAQRAYEQRIASLESKLAELSETLAKYNRNRQEDQLEILQLREKISELSSLAAASVCSLKDVSCQTYTESTITEEMKDAKQIDEKLSIDQERNKFSEKQADNILNLSTGSHLSSTVNSSKTTKERDSHTNILENELKNLEIKLQMLTDQNNFLSEQYDETVLRYEKQIDELRKQQTLIVSRFDNDIQDLHKNYRSQISELETQVQKQRQRTIALLEEKEQEVTTLKSSFQLFVPGNKQTLLSDFPPESRSVSQLTEVLNDTSKVNVQENPHILHYAHELARRDVVITGLRKNCCQLENSLREAKKEMIMLKQSNQEKVNALKNHLSRLERCQTREGANLEYLKNVIVNYLQTNNASNKSHMLNAIAVILKLTDSEINKIKSAL